MVQQTINLYAWRENEKMIPPVLITQGIGFKNGNLPPAGSGDNDRFDGQERFV